MARGFREYYEQWAGPARRAYAAGASLRLPGAYSAAEEVIVCGMGGSGVAGDYLAAVNARYGGAPVHVVKGAEPPAWAGKGTLVYAVSFSGNTRETLECARRARARGASVAAVTTGGRLAEWARRVGSPLLIVEEAPAPRAGWPQLFYSLLGSAAAEGLTNAPLSDVEESLELLSSRLGDARKAAGDLASWVVEARGIPVIVVPEPYWAAAVRARSEFAENAKTLVIASQLPEAGHNELEAWASTSTPLEFIALDPGEEPWGRLLSEALALARPASLHMLRLEGRGFLAKLAWATWVAGLASIEAAERRGIDPEKLTAVKSFRKVVEESTGWGRGA